jgi:hypothetical protein
MKYRDQPAELDTGIGLRTILRLSFSIDYTTQK